ncbi:conserved oligomeric Golgi complex subunit 7 [Adelges cooleyi]|uniref:conserved oligomeric Golgi complex subunit 7 n=1 Tax=Adelges cooleyi TaxID=133065 RepID=UPI0021800328|nr:conserved oligomeric Golgi complex subunit 7 [Adelges cooleyi]
MDISLFSEKDFNVVNWINNTLKDKPPDQCREIIPSMLKKLQLCVEQVNEVLDDSTEQVLFSLPKVINDIEQFENQAIHIKQKITDLKQEINTVKSNTGESLIKLQIYDEIKCKMEITKHALEEADNWTKLITDIETLIENEELEQVTSRMVRMQKSLAVLENVSDYELRKNQLEELKNKLEVILTPMLNDAFENQKIDESKSYVQIFTDLDKRDQIIKYYIKCNKNKLRKEWSSKIYDKESSTNPVLFIENFYDAIIQRKKQQMVLFKKLFNNEEQPEIESQLILSYGDLFNTLELPLFELVDVSMKAHHEPLTLLLNLFTATELFIKGIRNDSKISESFDWNDVLINIYRPLIPQLASYKELEYEHTKKNTELKLNNDDLVDIVQAFTQSQLTGFRTSEEAKRRSAVFNHCVFPGMVFAINKIFSSIIEGGKEVLKKILTTIKSGDNWNLFQICLKFLQSSGEFLRELYFLESEFKSCLLTNENLALETSKYLLSEEKQKELNTIIQFLKEDKQWKLFRETIQGTEKLCSHIYQTFYKISFLPISHYLKQVDKVKFSKENYSDSHRFTPREYITQIGQYLITLPQHVEPFLVRDNEAITIVLNLADRRYSDANQEESYTNVLLKILANNTCDLYIEQIQSLRDLNNFAAQHLAADIEYLGYVLEELGVKLNDTTKQIMNLLRLQNEEYTMKSSSVAAPKVVAVIAKIRNIK